MKTAPLTNRRRKIVDMSEDTFQILYTNAKTYNVNLSAYIEHILDEWVEDLRDAQLYKHLSETKPDGHVMLSEKEQDSFEKWLGV